MIHHDRSKAIMSIISKRHPKTGETMSAPAMPEKHTDEDGHKDGRHSAAQDIMMAIHERSPAKLMEALANFHDMHSAHAASERTAEMEEENLK